MLTDVVNLFCHRSLNIPLAFKLCVVVFTVVNSQTITFSASNVAGTDIALPGNVVEGSSAVFKCAYPTAQTGSNVIVKLLVANSSTPSSYTAQIACGPPGNLEISNLVKAGEPVYLAASNATCSANDFTVTAVLRKDWPIHYRCEYNTVTLGEPVLSDITLRTHTRPSTPIVTKSPNMMTFKENDAVNFTCSSMGRPPPLLRFSYGSTVVPDAVQSPNTTDLDDPSGLATLTWSTNVNKLMNDKRLMCSVYGHPSRSSISADILLAVYFGPEDIVRTVRWNLMDSDTKVLNCGFRSHGSLDYTWYNKTVSSGNSLNEKSSDLTLSAGSYSYVTQDVEVVENFICKGINTNNNDKSATSTITLTVHRSDITTTSTAITSTSASEKPANTAAPVQAKTTSAPLPGYGIGLIVGGAVLLIVVVVVVVALVLRARQSPAARKKQAASKNEGGVGYSSHNGNNSQPDVVRNSYIAPDVPRSPQEFNRRSQNVEDYAEAIDDKPRSRKPIAYSMDDLNDSFDGYPDGTMGGGPPAYYPYEPSGQRGYPPQPDFSSYGAAC